jgi:hypothetical protein
MGHRTYGADEDDCGETNAPEDGWVDKGEAAIEAIAEGEEANPRREGQAFHDEVEAPGHHCIHLALSIPSAIGNGAMRPCLGIMTEPSLT